MRRSDTDTFLSVLCWVSTFQHKLAQAKWALVASLQLWISAVSAVNLNQRNPIFTALCWSSDWEIKTLDCNDGLITITQFSHWYSYKRPHTWLDYHHSFMLGSAALPWSLIDNGFETNCHDGATKVAYLLYKISNIKITKNQAHL